MGIASLHPSCALRCAASGACWSVDHTIPATPGREVVGWVERSETHRWLPRGDGYRFAPPILRSTLRSIRGMLACGSHDPRCTWPRSCRMGRARAKPIDGFREVMGIASLHPSYALRCAASGACWPVDHTIPATPGRAVVGWVERSETHRWLPRSDGDRFAPPILRPTLRSIRGVLACGSHDPRYTWPRSRRMGRAKAIPIDGFREVMGIASLHPSYALRCAASGARWPVDHTIPAAPGRAVVGWVERKRYPSMASEK